MSEKAKKALKTIGLDLGREALAYLTFLIISGVLSFVFVTAGLSLAHELRIGRHPIYIAAAILLPLSFYSIHRAFELYDVRAQEAFPFDTLERYGFFSGMRILFTSPVLLRKLIIHLALILLTVALFPYELGFRFLIGSFYPAFDMTRSAAELTQLAVAAPVLTVTLILAKTSAHKWWIIAPTGERDKIFGASSKNTRLLLELLKIMLVYGVSYPVLPSVFMLVLSAVLTFGKFTIGIWMTVLAVIVIVASLRSIIAIGRRTSFLRRMKRSLAREGYALSKIQRPILSVFLPDMDEDFTVSKGDVTYTCKLLGTAHRRRPVYISPKGIMTEKRTVSFMKMTLFHIMHDTRYDIEGENKIVILTPMPRRVYVNYGRTESAPDDGDGGVAPTYVFARAAAMGGGFKQSRATDRHIHGPGYISDVDRGIIKPFETGERIGDTKFYTPSGFISAIDNNCLDR